MPSKSKLKGNRLETDIKKFFNELYDTDEFTRTPGSGAIMGQSNFGRNSGLSDSTKITLGSDLICPDWFRFSVECKNYADSPKHHLIIAGPDRSLDKWLGETIFDSIQLKLIPMLVFLTTRKGTFFALPYDPFKVVIESSNITNYLIYDGFVIFSKENYKQMHNVILEHSKECFDECITWCKGKYGQHYLQRLIDIFGNNKVDAAKKEATQQLLQQIATNEQ